MLLGEPVEPEEASVRKARELVQLLQAEVLPFVDLVGVTRRADGWELVRVDVRPEVPTLPVNDIRMVEPIAVEFDPADRLEPGAITLRPDFPVCPAYLRPCAGRTLEALSVRRALHRAAASLDGGCLCAALAHLAE